MFSVSSEDCPATIIIPRVLPHVIMLPGCLMKNVTSRHRHDDTPESNQHTPVSRRKARSLKMLNQTGMKCSSFSSELPFLWPGKRSGARTPKATEWSGAFRAKETGNWPAGRRPAHIVVFAGTPATDPSNLRIENGHCFAGPSLFYFSTELPELFTRSIGPGKTNFRIAV